MCCHACLQVYERALPYFELAAAIQPKEVKWSLMVASCYRRIGAYDQALRRCDNPYKPKDPKP
jgi:intraflagellar transport protein 88